MSRQLTLILTPREAADAKTYTTLAARRMGVAERDIALVRVVKRSIDARRGAPKVNLTLEIYVDGEPEPAPVRFDYPSVAGRTPVVIVGAGPAGLFAALRLIELGLRPVLLEHPRPGHKMSGFTDNYLRVELEAPAELDNCIVPVRLAGLSAEDELFKDCQLV